MTGNRKTTLLVNGTVLLVSLFLHLVLLFFHLDLKDPAEFEEMLPAFPMIDAVLVELPEAASAPVVPPEPIPEPKIEQEVNDAAVADETAEEEPPPEPIETSEALPEETTENPAVEQPPVNFIPFYKVEKRPQFLFRAELRYPVQAKKNRVEGTVILEADIDAGGNLVRTNIVKSAGFGFDEAAAEMIRNSKFSPAVMDGRNVAVRMRFTVKFEL